MTKKRQKKKELPGELEETISDLKMGSSGLGPAVVIIAIVLIAAAALIIMPSERNFCGDGQCNYGENCDSCSSDCGECIICGNGDCEEGETCSSCSIDCGDCFKGELPEDEPELNYVPAREDGEPETNESLNKNIFEGTIGVANEKTYKEDGYVIIKYFYDQSCPLCLSPVNWDEELRDFAKEMDDVVILETFNTVKEGWAYEAWASSALQTIPEPVIRLEGKRDGESTYKLLYSKSLSDISDDPKNDLRELVCGMSSRC